VVAHGRAHRLELSSSRRGLRELRWHELPDANGPSSVEGTSSAVVGPSPMDGGAGPVLSLREVVGRAESYEPACSITREALVRHRHDAHVSVSTLAAELRRVETSPIVLNRALRESVLRALERDGLTLGEIAIRCGRIKRDGRGRASGETTWLARRVGLARDARKREPSPWIHSDVLALISRTGIGVSPREVELG
jgi:hypothetical protein